MPLRCELFFLFQFFGKLLRSNSHEKDFDLAIAAGSSCFGRRDKRCSICSFKPSCAERERTAKYASYNARHHAGFTKMTPTFANGERTPQVAMSAATGRDKLQTGGAHASLKHINPISLTPGGGSGDITAASLSIPNLWETAS